MDPPIYAQNGAGLVSSSFFNPLAIPLLRFIAVFSQVQFRKMEDTVFSESVASLTTSSRSDSHENGWASLSPLY